MSKIVYETTDAASYDPFSFNSLQWPQLHVPPINLYNVPGANKAPNPLATQVGGSHYKGKAIEPIEYISANKLNYSEGAIVKYITRWREKGGVQDLEKIKHFVDLLIAMEQKYGQLQNSQGNVSKKAPWSDSGPMEETA